jgi:hypothetical protein
MDSAGAAFGNAMDVRRGAHDLDYVIVNLVLFRLIGPPMPGEGMGRVVFSLVYMTVAIGVPLSTALLLRRRRATLT